jgi:hypothetical protein
MKAQNTTLYTVNDSAGTPAALQNGLIGVLL